jgi:hypothetical protein
MTVRRQVVTLTSLTGPLVTTVIEWGEGWLNAEVTVIGSDGVIALDVATVIVWAAAAGASTAVVSRQTTSRRFMDPFGQN